MMRSAERFSWMEATSKDGESDIRAAMGAGIGRARKANPRRHQIFTHPV